MKTSPLQKSVKNNFLYGLLTGSLTMGCHNTGDFSHQRLFSQTVEEKRSPPTSGSQHEKNKPDLTSAQRVADLFKDDVLEKALQYKIKKEKPSQTGIQIIVSGATVSEELELVSTKDREKGAEKITIIYKKGYLGLKTGGSFLPPKGSLEILCASLGCGVKNYGFKDKNELLRAVKILGAFIKNLSWNTSSSRRKSLSSSLSTFSLLDESRETFILMISIVGIVVTALTLGSCVFFLSRQEFIRQFARWVTGLLRPVVEDGTQGVSAAPQAAMFETQLVAIVINPGDDREQYILSPQTPVGPDRLAELNQTIENLRTSNRTDGPGEP